MYLKEGAKPVAQKQRPVPVYMMKPLRKKFDEFLEEEVNKPGVGPQHSSD